MRLAGPYGGGASACLSIPHGRKQQSNVESDEHSDEHSENLRVIYGNTDELKLKMLNLIITGTNSTREQPHLGILGTISTRKRIPLWIGPHSSIPQIRVLCTALAPAVINFWLRPQNHGAMAPPHPPPHPAAQQVSKSQLI